jgi:hypothetical protein
MNFVRLPEITYQKLVHFKTYVEETAPIPYEGCLAKVEIAKEN